MAIGSGVSLPEVAENPTFPILSTLAYTTGLGYRPTCDLGNDTAQQTQQIFAHANLLQICYGLVSYVADLLLGLRQLVTGKLV